MGLIKVHREDLEAARYALQEVLDESTVDHIDGVGVSKLNAILSTLNAMLNKEIRE